MPVDYVSNANATFVVEVGHQRENDSIDENVEEERLRETCLTGS